MPRYSFEVSSGPITVTQLSDVELADRNALWDRIVDLARTTREPGARLIVRDGAVSGSPAPPMDSGRHVSVPAA